MKSYAASAFLDLARYAQGHASQQKSGTIGIDIKQHDMPDEGIQPGDEDEANSVWVCCKR